MERLAALGAAAGARGGGRRARPRRTARCGRATPGRRRRGPSSSARGCAARAGAAPALPERPPRRRRARRRAVGARPVRRRRSRTGCVHGRGSVDMKGGVVAALHADGGGRATAGAAPAEVVVQARRLRGGRRPGDVRGARADDALRRRADPRADRVRRRGRAGGALTFIGTVPGRSAHAAVRLEGVSRDRPLRRRSTARWPSTSGGSTPTSRTRSCASSPLPYPLLVGRVEAGRWSSQVPDPLRFEGRLGVRVGETVEDARAGARGRGRARRLPGGRDRLDGRAVRAGRDADPTQPFVGPSAPPPPTSSARRPPLAGVPYGSRHAALRRARHPVRDVRHRRPRARARRRRARRDRRRVRVARTLVRVILRFDPEVSDA